MAWLIAYDIASPRRWRRVNARIADRGFRLQYSLYWAPVSARAIDALMSELATVIDPGEDDVRAYPFPADAWCRLWGPPPWGDGVTNTFSARFAPHWQGPRGLARADRKG